MTGRLFRTSLTLSCPNPRGSHICIHVMWLACFLAWFDRYGQRERSSSLSARLLAPIPSDAYAPRPGSLFAVARGLHIVQRQRHAVVGAAAPSPTVVAFLLHGLLPSPRAGDTAAK